MKLVLYIFETMDIHVFKFHKINDSLNSKELHALYTKDATLIFANNPPVVGLENIINVCYSPLFTFGLAVSKYKAESWCRFSALRKHEA